MQENTQISYHLGLTHQLFDITNKILLENLNDIDWIHKLLGWGNKYITNDSSIFPKTENEVLESRKINLRWNRLVNIPEELCSLKQLKILELNNNNLTDLPIEIAQLEYLEELNLNINNLRKLPEEIIKLNNLKVLNIKNNKYLELSNKQVIWLESLVANGCTVKYDKYKFKLGE